MKASVVDLRYRMAEVLAALDRREQVTITSHGTVRGTIVPAGRQARVQVANHPFFGMNQGDDQSVDAVMAALRSGRTDAV